MTQQGGDRKYGHGDEVTMLNNHGSTVEAGLAVSVNGDGGTHPQFALADAAGAGDAVGVAANTSDDGEAADVGMRGAFWVRVESSVVAGDEMATPDSSATSGAITPGVLGAGGSTGYYALTDAQELVAGSGNYYAVVHLG